MPHTLVRTYECRGRDAHGHAGFDVLLVERGAPAHDVSSHRMRRSQAQECTS